MNIFIKKLLRYEYLRALFDKIEKETEKMIISIHQPNFFPWMPFFEKIEQSDIYIVLGNCQFEKNNFQNRFFYDGAWSTMSVRRGNNKIIEKEYFSPDFDWKKIKKRMKAKGRNIEFLDDCILNSLYETNVCIIKKLLKCLNIRTQVVHDYPTDLMGTERLVDLCKRFGATKYLSGPSGKKYMDVKLFEMAEIEVEFFKAKNTNHVIDEI